MSLTEIPGAIIEFIEAARAGNTRDLVANLTTDAAVFDRGHEHRGAAIVHWGNWLFAQPRKLISPIKATDKDGIAIIYVVVSDTRRTKPEQFEWSFQMVGQKISALTVQAIDLPDLPPPVAGFIFAMNLSDLDGLLTTFADDAIVNDQLYEYRGTAAIRQWATRDIIGQKTTMYVTKTLRRYEETLVIAHVDGDFDRKGLPDPLVLTFYFSVADHKIIQLIILRNESEP